MVQLRSLLALLTGFVSKHYLNASFVRVHTLSTSRTCGAEQLDSTPPQ